MRPLRHYKSQSRKVSKSQRGSRTHPLRLCDFETLRLLLPMHQIGFVHVDRVSVVEQRNENRQTDRGFRGGDGHDEKDEDESVSLPELFGVGEEREVHRVHHQLDGHEDGDAVPAREHAHDVDREQDRAEDQKPLRRDHFVTSEGRVRPLSSRAPTIAASRRMETISNGKIYASNIRTPMSYAVALNSAAGGPRTTYFTMKYTRPMPNAAQLV